MNKPIRTVIILPTYNESKNIGILLDCLEKQNKSCALADISVLVVDDSSPDGTSDIVNEIKKKNKNVHLITGKKQGLGTAYVRGFTYAMNEMKAEIVFQMDADLSHDPEDIPRFIQEILKGNDFVIGSRYVKGGSLPSSWSRLRRANSKCGNIVARYIAGLRSVKDCTSGYRAIRTDVLRKIELDKLGVTGYAVMMNLLYQAAAVNAKIKEIPIHFAERTNGKSKLRINDVFEFILNAFYLRLHKKSYQRSVAGS